MALHVPAHPAGIADHHLLRNALLSIGIVALALVLGVTALLIRPVATTPAATVSEAQSLVEFRAGERPTLVESQYLVEFRAGERTLR